MSKQQKATDLLGRLRRNREEMQALADELEAVEDRASREAVMLADRLAGKRMMVQALNEQANELMSVE